MKCSAGSRSCETLFDVAGKRKQRDDLTAKMGEPGFWDNPDKAQDVINQLKPLNGLIKPFEDIEAAAGDIQALAELAEEDAELEAELAKELGPFEQRLEDFELRSMLDG